MRPIVSGLSINNLSVLGHFEGITIVVVTLFDVSAASRLVACR